MAPWNDNANPFDAAGFATTLLPAPEELYRARKRIYRIWKRCHKDEAALALFPYPLSTAHRAVSWLLADDTTPLEIAKAAMHFGDGGTSTFKQSWQPQRFDMPGIKALPAFLVAYLLTLRIRSSNSPCDGMITITSPSADLPYHQVHAREFRNLLRQAIDRYDYSGKAQRQRRRQRSNHWQASDAL